MDQIKEDYRQNILNESLSDSIFFQCHENEQGLSFGYLLYPTGILVISQIFVYYALHSNKYTEMVLSKVRFYFQDI